MSTVLMVGAGETGERLPAGVCGLEPRGVDPCECPRDGAYERIDAADTAGGVWRAAFASVKRMAVEGPAEAPFALRRDVGVELLEEPASTLDRVGDASQRFGFVYRGLRVTAPLEFVEDLERELPQDVCICISHDACDGGGRSFVATELFSSMACLLSGGGGDKYGEVPASSAAARVRDFLREQ